MKQTQSAGKCVQASHDWFWFFFLLDKEVMRALYKPIAYRTNAQNPENANRITFDTQVIAAIPEKVYCFPHTFGSVKKQR